MTRISKPKMSHFQRLLNKQKDQMNRLQEILNSHLPSGILLTNDVNNAVLKAMKQVQTMNNVEAGYTHISICLDRSGSMESIRQDMIGGFNAFIKSQQQLPGKLTVSLVQFDTEYQKIYNFIDGKEVVELTTETFVPRGGTALNDSFYRLIEETREYIDEMDGNRPERVLFLSITDGEENGSRKRTTADLKQLIKQYEQDYKWTFSYIGAEQDSFAEGGARGISSKNSMNFDKSRAGVYMAFDKLDTASVMYRSAVSLDAANTAFNLSEEDNKQ